MRCTHFKQLLLTTAIGATLTACSSGGGGSKGPTPPTSPPYDSFAQQPADPSNLATQADEFEDGEYNGLGYLDTINASTAYARGGTGEGVTVGVVDSGVQGSHNEFDDGNGGSKVTVVQSDYSRFGETRTDEAIDHGTYVAGIIAANRDGAPVVDGQSFNMHGVAYKANIAAYEIPLGSGGGAYEPIDLPGTPIPTDSFFGEMFGRISAESDIVNMSFGFSGNIANYSSSAASSSFPSLLAELRQSDTAASDRTIYVVAAGNARGALDAFGQPADASSPELLAGLPHLFPELQNHMLAVVATGADGALTSYSNACGVAAAFCLAAPGGGSSTGSNRENVMWGPVASNPPGGPADDYYAGSAGTSNATPLVSGSLAILKQMFPSVGNDEIVDRLLQTANKTGIYSNQSIYGQGLLDLGAATAPLGTATVATATFIDGASAPAASTHFGATGSAVGDGLTMSLAGHNIAVFDQMGFPFQVSAQSLVSHPNSTPATHNLHHNSIDTGTGLRMQSGLDVDTQRFDQRFHTELRHRQRRDYLAVHFTDADTGAERFSGMRANPGWFFGLYGNAALQPGNTEDDSAFAAPWLRFARDGWSSGAGLAKGSDKLRFGVFRGKASWDQTQTPSPRHDHTQGQGAIVEFARSFRGGSISLQTGVLDEQQSFLGISTSGALGNGSNADTWFSGINAQVELAGNWQGLMAWYGGMTQPQIQGGLLSVNDKLFSSSFAMGVAGHSLWQRGDSLGLFVSQPLRIESGRADLRLPTGRTLDRQVIYEPLALNLEPSAREIRLEMNYGFDLGQVRATASVNYIQNPGHSHLTEDTVSTQLSVAIPIKL